MSRAEKALPDIEGIKGCLQAKEENQKIEDLYPQLVPLVHLFPFSTYPTPSLFYSLSISHLKVALTNSKECSDNALQFYVNAAAQLLKEIAIQQILQQSLDQYLAFWRSVQEKEKKWRKEQERNDREKQRLQAETLKIEVRKQDQRLKFSSLRAR